MPLIMLTAGTAVTGAVLAAGSRILAGQQARTWYRTAIRKTKER